MKHFFVFLFLLFGFYSFGISPDSSSVKLGFTTDYGFIIPHSSSLRPIITNDTKFINVEASKQLNGTQDWHKLYNFPTLGFNYLYADFGNDTLGKAHTLSSFLQFNIFRNKQIDLNYRISCGIAYMTERYHYVFNPLNTAISSKFNYHFNAAFNANFTIYKNLILKTSVNFSHFSNGALKKPNYGLNLVHIGAGLLYDIETKNRKSISEKSILKHQDNISVYAFWSTREAYNLTDTNFVVKTLSVDFNKNISQKSTFGIGFDVFHDKSMKTIYRREEQDFEPEKYFNSGIHFLYEFHFNRLTMILQPAVYLLPWKKVDGFIYSRIGLRYNVTKSILINISLRNHLQTAYCIEWGIGYKFYKKENHRKL